MPILNIEDVVKRPVVIHVVAEMGAGKSTFIKLLQQYESWLGSEGMLEGKLVNPLPEDYPEVIWDEYQDAITGKERKGIIFKVQSWFMNQKLALIYRAHGLDYPGSPGFYNSGEGQGDFGISSRLMKYDNSFLEPRNPGFYIVERDPREDYFVFASRYEHLFPEEGADNNSSFNRYKEIYRSLIENSPKPDLIVRLKTTPEVSMRRVEERQTREKLTIEDYREMAARYTLYIDKWIRESKIPCIEIDTSQELFDFNTPDGQNYFLTAFFRGLNKNGFWDTKYHYLPISQLINNHH